MDLKTFLNRFPWEENYLYHGKPLDWLWHFSLPVSAEEIWPFLIDTSAFNKRIGVPEMFFEERNGRMYGRSQNAGIKMEWEEVPWEWEYKRSLNNARLYSQGFAKLVRSRYYLEETEDGLDLYVYFGWIPRHRWGKWLLNIGMRSLEKDYRKGLALIASQINQKKQGSFSAGPGKGRLPESKPRSQGLPIGTSENKDRENLAARDYPEKLIQISQSFLKEGFSPDLIQNLVSFILQEDDSELYRIRVKEVAHRLNLSLKEIIRLFLYGCRFGLFTISWDVVCPHCRGVRTEAKHLGDLPKSDACDVCEIDFDATSLNSIEVTFHIHPSIRDVQKRYFCAAEPATKQHIFYQSHLAPFENRDLRLNLAAGIYRFRNLGAKAYSLVSIDEKSVETSAVLPWAVNRLPQDLEISKETQIKLINDTERNMGFIIETREEDQYSLRPAELFNLQEFRDIFAEESIAPGLSLDIGIQTILFTDIIGSTKMYSELGDAKAFKMVREHFVSVFRIIQENEGVVVKTIGDSVMAAFPSSFHAFVGSKDLQEFFHSGDRKDVLIRTTIHTGPCLAVNLNSNVDYFGNTVNLAAKIQKAAKSGEIVFTDSVFRDPKIREFLIERGEKLVRSPFFQDWSGSKIPIYRYRLGIEKKSVSEGSDTMTGDFVN
jgi:class 3 adenylate cyclase